MISPLVGEMSRSDRGGLGVRTLRPCPFRARSSACAARISRTFSTRSLLGNRIPAPTRASRQAVLSVISPDRRLPSIRSLICTSPAARSSPPWMMASGRAATVGIFQLVAEILLVALVHFGADAGIAQVLRQLLVAAEAFGVAVHDADDDRGDDLVLCRACRDSSSAVIRRETPMEKPVAGTGWPMKRETRPS